MKNLRAFAIAALILVISAFSFFLPNTTVKIKKSIYSPPPVYLNNNIYSEFLIGGIHNRTEHGLSYIRSNELKFNLWHAYIDGKETFQGSNYFEPFGWFGTDCYDQLRAMFE